MRSPARLDPSESMLTIFPDVGAYSAFFSPETRCNISIVFTEKMKTDSLITLWLDNLGTFISDLVLQILSWLAQEERERIRKRQREGINTARQNAIKFGRPKAEITEALAVSYKQWKEGNITATAAINMAGMKRTTFYKLVKEL